MLESIIKQIEELKDTVEFPEENIYILVDYDTGRVWTSNDIVGYDCPVNVDWMNNDLENNLDKFIEYFSKEYQDYHWN